MSLIPVVGRRSWQTRTLFAVLYLALSLGALSMVYPFLIMIGSSVTSQFDQNQYHIIPDYLLSDRALFGKYAEDKFGADMTALNAAYDTDFVKLQDVVPPTQSDSGRVRDWNAFARTLPARDKKVGFGGAPGSFSPSLLLDRYHAFLQTRFHNDILALDRAYTQEDASFLSVSPPFQQPTKRSWTPDASPKSRDWAEFQKTLPANFFVIVGGDAIYQKWLKEEAYAKLADLNTAWGTQYKNFTDIPLPAHPAGDAAQRRDWETFVRTKMPFRFAQVAPSAAPAYQAFLQGRYKDSLTAYNAAHADRAASFARVRLPDPDSVPAQGPPLLDWLDFLKAAPLAALTVDTAETRYRDYARNTYGLTPAVAETLPLPAYQSDWAYTRAHSGELRRSFVTRNYLLVTQYIALHGNGVLVTIVYCTLAVLTALIVNPLCAYALSRYNLPYGNAVLLFVLATMAFPAEVAMIPNFLLLKNLGLLNTFAALILPGAASGFSIFLMKGFFDSLPKELFEAGTLDGASELRMFANITLPLSRPIFAVIALQAFTGAYSAFLFALILCQNSKMWTIMVWLYELQSGAAPQYVMMAALTLAAVPTLLVFIFAQNTIMKGIIIPSEK